MKEQMKLDAFETAVKAAPGGVGVAIYQLTLADWVAVVTILYFLLQIGLLLHKYWLLWRERKNAKGT